MMTDSVEIRTISRVQPQDWRWKARWWEDVFFGLVPALALVPLVMLEFSQLWTRPHTRLFAVPIIVVLVVVVVNWRSKRSESTQRVLAAYCLQITTIIVMLANWSSFSPWLAHLCLVPVFAGWALQRFGDVPWPRVAAWSFLLATSLRLPNDLDLHLMSWLEHSATALVALILDGLHQPFLIEGGRMTVTSPDPLYVLAFDIQQTVRTAFSLNQLCCLCMWLLTCGRRSLITGIFMLSTIPVWYVIMTVLHLLAIVAALHFFNTDLTAGKKLLALSLCTFTVVACLLWLSDRFLWKMLQPVPPLDSEFEPEFRVLNWFIVWPQADPFNDVDYDRSRVAKSKPNALSARWLSIHVVVRRVCLSCLLIGAVASFFLTNRAYAAARSVRSLPAIRTEMLAQVGSRDSLPIEIADWKCLDFDRQLQTVEGINRGQLSWKYAWQDQILELKVSFPFAADSTLEQEFVEKGWRIVDQQESEVRLENELGGNALAMIADQTVGQPGQYELHALHYRVTLLCESGDELSKEQLEAMRQSFRSAVTRVTEAVDEPIAKVLEGSR